MHDVMGRRGLTVLELMVVLAVSAILMAVAAPSFMPIAQSNRTLAESDLLLGALKVAKAEALKQGLPVAVCASTDGSTCSGSASWQAGWITYLDVNGNKVRNTATDTLIKVQGDLPGSDTLVASPSTSVVAFSRDGFALNQGSAVTWTIKTSPASNSATRCLVLGVVGRLQEVNYNGSTCL
jgi:type IV fimbrial biogenesis protein FimT